MEGRRVAGYLLYLCEALLVSRCGEFWRRGEGGELGWVISCGWRGVVVRLREGGGYECLQGYVHACERKGGREGRVQQDTDVSP